MVIQKTHLLYRKNMESKVAVDHFIEKGRCKKLKQEETMIVLEYLG